MNRRNFFASAAAGIAALLGVKAAKALPVAIALYIEHSIDSRVDDKFRSVITYTKSARLTRHLLEGERPPNNLDEAPTIEGFELACSISRSDLYFPSYEWVYCFQEKLNA